MDNLDAENALYWLLKLFTVHNREGWEDGPTEDEVRERVLDLLWNAGVDPGVETHAAAIKAFCQRVEQRGFLTHWSCDLGGWTETARVAVMQNKENSK